MKRTVTLITTAAVVVVLAACNVTVTPPGPPANTIDVTATLNPNQALGSFTGLGAGQAQVFRVAVPGNVTQADLLYIELDKEIELEVLPAAYTSVIYSSNSAALFASGRFGIQSLTSASDGIETQTVNTPVTCRGSCVLVRANTVSDPFYVRVRNDSGAAINFQLYVYGDVYADSNEMINGTIATAPNLVAFDAGAIETVGDIDLWRMPNNGTISFDTVAGGPRLEARILTASGVEVPGTQNGGPYYDGDSFFVIAGEYVRVRAVSAVEAGASARSTYYLEYGTPVAR